MSGPRLIDLDKYFESMNVTSEMKDKVYRIFGVDIGTDNISIEWMRKELYEMLYERKITSNEVHVFIELIARWGRRNG